MNKLTSYLYDEIEVGQTAKLSKKVTRKIIDTFAIITSDVNPLHVDAQFAKHARFKKIIAHGLFGETLISAVLGTRLPGPGTIFIKQTVHYLKPVFVNDTLTAIVIVIAKKRKHRIILETQCINQKKEIVIKGIAKVLPPTHRVAWKTKKVGKITLTK